jgi:chromosome segregation ATPase
MGKEPGKKQTNNLQTGIPALPAWIKGAGAALLIALTYTTYQMVQAQDGLEQAGLEISKTQKARMAAQDAHAETTKELDAIKKVVATYREETATFIKEAAANKKEAAANKNEVAARIKEAAESMKETAAFKAAAATLKEAAATLKNNLSASKTALGALKDELKAAKGKLEMAQTKKEKGKIATEVREKLEQQIKASQDMQAAAMKQAETLEKAVTGFKEKITSLGKDLSTSRTSLGALQDELKTASGKLAQALAESEKYKSAAQANEKLAQQYKEKAEAAEAKAAQTQ